MAATSATAGATREQCDDASQGALREFARRLRQRTLPAGRVLFHQGQRLGRVYLLTSGAVQVSRRDPQGHARIVDLVLPGDVLGFCDFAAGVYADDALVLRESRVCSIDPRRWPPSGGRDASLPPLPPLSSLGAAQVQRAMRQSLRLRLRAPARIADWLLQLSQRMGGPDIELPLSWRDLAEYLDLRPETLSRTLRELERRQCLRRAGGTRLQLDLERLRQTRAAPRARQV